MSIVNKIITFFKGIKGKETVRSSEDYSKQKEAILNNLKKLGFKESNRQLKFHELFDVTWEPTCYEFEYTRIKDNIFTVVLIGFEYHRCDYKVRCSCRAFEKIYSSSIPIVDHSYIYKVITELESRIKIQVSSQDKND